MVLITNQKWELGVHSLHDISASHGTRLLEFDLPVNEDPLHQEVKADEELDGLLSFLDLVKALSQVVHLEDFIRQFV